MALYGLQDGARMRLHLTSVAEVEESDATIKASGIYDFWSYVHLQKFPDEITVGKLDSIGITSKDFIVDLIQRDIDTRFLTIPKTYKIDNFTFVTSELGADTASDLREYVAKYLEFRSLAIANKKKGSS